MKNIIGPILGGSIALFVAIWIILECIILPSKVPSYISNSEWITFIGTYFSSVLGGTIAIVGIWWQLEQPKKEHKKRVEGYLKHIIDENLKDKEELEKKILNLECMTSYTREYFAPQNRDEISNLFDEFEINYFNNNIDIILSFDFGKKIIDINKKINDFNKEYKKYIERLHLKYNFLISLEKNKEIKIQLMGDYLVQLSGLLDGLNYMNYNTYCILGTESVVQLRYIKKKEELKDLLLLFEKLKSKRLDYKEFKLLSNEKKIKLSVDIKKEVFNFMLEKISSMKEFEDKTKLINFIYTDYRVTGKAFEIYKEIEEVKKIM